LKHSDWVMKKATLKEIDSILSLDYRVYSDDWHVSNDYVQHVMQKNPEVYNILRTKDGIKGIFSLFPLDQSAYERVLHGALEETELADRILPYNGPQHVYIYLISLLVDIDDEQRKLYAKCIIEAIPRELRRLKNQGIIINEIGAIAITDDGNRILKRIGFSTTEQVSLFDQSFHVYRAQVDDIYRAIQTTE